MNSKWSLGILFPHHSIAVVVRIYLIGHNQRERAHSGFLLFFIILPSFNRENSWAIPHANSFKISSGRDSWVVDSNPDQKLDKERNHFSLIFYVQEGMMRVLRTFPSGSPTHYSWGHDRRESGERQLGERYRSCWALGHSRANALSVWPKSNLAKDEENGNWEYTHIERR